MSWRGYGNKNPYGRPIAQKLGARARGGRGRGGKGRGAGGRTTSQTRSETHLDVVTKQLLSANRLKMNELYNKMEEMKKELRTVKDENKLYKRMQHKQEKALVKFEDRESELPQLIQAHTNEIRTLKDQVRRTREKYDKTDRYLRDAEDELETAKARLKKYKALAEQKDLEERSELDKKVNKAELAIEEKECKIKEVQRHLEMLKKNHRHELGIERARAKEIQKHLDDAEEAKAKLEAQVREKEKQLEAKNIYSNRIGKPSSYNGTPAESPAPWRQNLKKKSDSLTDLAPRDKAKAYEQKRKGEEKKKQDKSPRRREPKQKWEVEETEKDVIADDDSPGGPNFNFKSLDRQDSESEFWRRQEERHKRDQHNREKQEDERRRRAEEEEKREQSKFQQQRSKLQRDMEERERAERDRKEADDRERERERREREERERGEREERERGERERVERDDRERREREERWETEQRERKEREKLDNDPRLVEERRKKDELLRRLQAMDANRDGSQPSADPFAPSDSTRARGQGDSPLAHSPSRKAGKDLFAFSRGDSSESPSSSKKDYSFTRQIENMHKGKPSNEDVSVGYIDRQKKLKASREDGDTGGYMPSFVSPSKTPSKQKKPMSLLDNDPKPASKPTGSQDKKSKLMADLFGGTGSPAKKDDGDDFFLTSKPPPKQPPPKQQSQTKKSTGFPWDDSSSTSAKVNGSAYRESSQLFGGGAALVDDDPSGGRSPKSNMLPRRSRQHASTLNSKPVMNVDSLDDDLEEVIL
ncbi:hypothetical protein V1264_016401 [Littorina saxatilis]|uniref:Lebercilin domain-containing protein n=1 Tax=Littorina saxatilis TaxID=31220 RepID=A0AAN9BNZ2_9CAEN